MEEKLKRKQKEMIKYSFIVPVYNVERYLKRCLDSIIAQTYHDYEAILIDDGSTDSSGQLVDEYALIYPDKMRVIHQKNAGLGGARNTGIEAAKGEYLIMVDSDDYISERMLETVDRYLIQYHNDILILILLWKRKWKSDGTAFAWGAPLYADYKAAVFARDTCGVE